MKLTAESWIHGWRRYGEVGLSEMVKMKTEQMRMERGL